MKRMLSLVLVLMLVLAIPAACAEEAQWKNQQQYPVSDTKLELTMMGPKAAIQGEWENMWWFDYMEEMTNIHWDFNLVPSDSFAEKKNLVLASQDLPDLFYGGGITKADEVMYGGQGLLIPLNDIIDEHMPNLKAAMEKWPELRGAITSLDGNIYSLPKIWQTPHGVTTKYFINTEWLEAVGKEMPTTLDELYDVLVAFRDHPELSPNGSVIPWGGVNEGSQVDQLVLSAYGLLGGSAKQGFSIYELVDGKVELAAALPEYKEVLTFIKKCYDEKLIDPEYFTQTGEQFNAKGANMQYGIFSAAAAYVVASLEDSAAYKLMAPIVAEEGQEQIWPKTTGITTGCAAITVTNPNPIETARWLDYTYSTEGANLLICGPEGEMWRWNDDKTAWLSNEEKFKELGSWSAYKGAYISPDSGCNTPHACDTTVFYDLENLPQIKKDYYDSTHVQLEPYLKPIFPSMYYTDEEQYEISALTADIESYLAQAKAKFIIGDMSLDEFETTYKDTLEKMQLSRLLEIQQGAYDRYCANLAA